MRWEYKTVEFKKRKAWSGQILVEDLQIELDNWGRQGWELIQTPTLGNPGYLRGLLLIFERAQH